MRVAIGRYFVDDLRLPRRWKPEGPWPFEQVSLKAPSVYLVAIDEAFVALRAAWPVFDAAEIAEVWAGTVDVTPDSLPVVDHRSEIPGLVICTGFSGHGFGTAPAAGELAADILTGSTPIIDPAPYRFARFE